MHLPDDATPVRHMTAAAQKVVRFTTGRERNDLDTDEQLNLSLVRLLEIIGEAATRVSQETREENTDIQWAQMVGMRNRLIHGYDVVDSDILWQTVVEDIPQLLVHLETIRIVSLSDDTEELCNGGAV